MGFGGGLMIVTCSIYIAESLPSSQVASCGTSVNFGIVLGILVISIVQSVSLPPAKNQSEYLTTNNWRIVFAFPICTCILNILMWHYFMKRDSIAFLIKIGNDDETLAQLREIYRGEEEDFIIDTLNELKATSARKL